VELFAKGSFSTPSATHITFHWYCECFAYSIDRRVLRLIHVPLQCGGGWSRLAAPFSSEASEKEKITFLTAVPTVYTQLMSTFSRLPASVQEAAKEAIHILIIYG